ncbi:protein-glutamate O-methyltransferase-like [Dendronephthya gigantea]|uniref:protein-glutamate O-methyltransferase-like n=1 Tax=Dendronephthya gigantea TaxID=151771 RepID=UPI001069AD5D|nr:protein-glutamate O-methyltransferase-like [Dendronephthya gigantea]
MEKTRPEPLSAKDQGSFAFDTVNRRMPVILTRVIDASSKLASKLTEQNDHKKADDVKSILNQLSGLKYEMETNKPLKHITDDQDDTEIWNNYLKGRQSLVAGKDLTFYTGAWLLCECYMYRRIFQAFVSSSMFKDYDPFSAQKQESFFSTMDSVKSLSENVINCTNMLSENSSDEAVRLEFETLLQFSLWANKCDLSVSGGVIKDGQHTGMAEQLEHLKAWILVDNTSEVWKLLRSIDRSTDHMIHIDFVLDNAGFEVFADLCLAEFFLSLNLAKTIYFHVKNIPWFVSDASERDINWLIAQMMQSENRFILQLGTRWQARFDDGSFQFKKHMYWTLAHDYSEMALAASDLYAELGKAKLVFFKGDLNYRKLVGDRKWPHTTPFTEALWGFCPAALCSLRTLKADVVVGLQPGQDTQAESKDPQWMVNGTYAVIQYQLNI